MEQLIRYQIERMLRKKQRNSALPLTPAARLHEDLGLDSIDMVELVITLEHRFHIEIPDQELEELRTVQHVFACVEGHLAAVAS